MKKFTFFYGTILLALMFSVSGVLAHEVTLRMEDSDGVGIESGQARYGSGSTYTTSWWPGGLTQADGNTNSVDLPTGTYSFEMLYNGTSARKISVYIDGDVTLTWVTTTVTLQYSGQIRYGGPSGVASWFKSSTATSTATKELLPGGTYTFRADPNGVFDLTIEDPPSMTKSLIHLKLGDHNGDPLAGGTARGGHGSSYSSWWATVNPTNAEGVAVDIRDGLQTNLSYQMLYNNGGQVQGPQDVSSNSFFEFQTELVTLRLEKCDGTPLDDGKPRFGSGASYWTSFWPNDNTGWSAPGETTAELFPGTYSFDMIYNSTSNQKISQVVPDGGATFTWQTTEVTLLYSGTISYGGSGDSRFFNMPTMDLLPGTYNFNFRGSNGNHYTALTFTGCEFGGNVYIFKVKNEADEGIADIPVSWHYNTNYNNTYKLLGTTDANGMLVSIGDVTTSGNQPFKAVLNHTSQRKETSDYTEFQIATATALVLDHDGNPMEGKEVRFQYHSGYSNLYVGLGNTDVNGKASVELFPGDYNFKAFVNRTSSEQSFTLSYNIPVDVTFQTELATALVQNCVLGPVPGVLVEFLWHNSYTGSGYRINVGTTGNDGIASIELFESDNLKFRAKINHTYSLKTFDLEPNVDVDVEFNPTLVNMNYAGSVKWKYNNYYFTDVTPNYLMFPGTYIFRFSGANNFTGTHTLDVSGCEFGGNVYIFKVKNEAGDGIADVPISWHYNTNYGNTYELLGTTDANGMLFSIEDVWKTGSQPFKAEYNKTSQRKLTTGYTEFQTTVATALVQDCDEEPVPGTLVEFLWHPNYTNTPFRLNVGTTGADGKASIELFPGEHKFSAKVNYTTSVQIFDLDPEVDVDVEFNPTLVNLHYPGSVKWKYNNYYFTDVTPDYYMFPGTYQFKFDNNVVEIPISGCYFDKTPIFVKLENSSGSGLPNADFDYRFGWGSYTNIGTDNTGDGIWYFIDGNPSNTKVKVSYKGATFEKEQNVQSNPMFIFNTINVTADLEDSGNGPLTADSWQYRYGWGSYAALDNTGEELLPVNVKVKVGFKGASVEKEQNVGTAPDFAFNTVNVTAELKDSNSNILTADNWQYRYGWGSYAALDNAGEELLPVNVKVKVGYKGASVEKEQYVGTAPAFAFNTVNVTADLKDSNGNILTADSWDYRYGWGSYATLNNAGEELLPVNVKVKVAYSGSSKEKEQNVGTSPYFSFEWDGSILKQDIVKEEFNISLINIYPNPVRGAATLEYNLEQANMVNISVYNSIGIEVAKLISSNQPEGNHDLIWNTQNLQPGIYYIRFNIGNTENVKPVIVQ